MIKPEFVEQLCQKLTESLPTGLKEGREHCQEQFHSILQGALNKLDLVTREEFDAQCAVLAKTREKLEALEKELKQKDS